MPTVSVIVACHNHEAFVGEALASVLTQTHPPDELLVLDDGSADGSAEAIRAALQGKPLPAKPMTLALWRNERPSGPGAARNRLIREAKGDIVAILDADDVWTPSRLERCLPFFDDPNVGLVYTDYETFRPDGSVIREYKEPYCRERMLGTCQITNACLVRLSLLVGPDGSPGPVGLYDERLRVAEDYDLFLRLTEKALAWHVPECLARIRVHPMNTSSAVTADTWRACWAECFRKLKERAG